MAPLTHAMVMAAGKGTRLRPLTEVVAKPALPVANEPAMGHVLRNLARRGIRNVVANCSYLGEQMQAVFGDGSTWGVDLSWSVEDSPQGTAGGVKRAEEHLRGDGGSFLVVSGDGLHDIDVLELARQHEASGALLTMALARVADPSQYGVAVLDDDGAIQQFQEKPAPGTELSNLSNTGIYVCSPEVLDLIPASGGYDFGDDGFPAWLAAGHRLQGVPIDAYWNDIGGPAAYLAGNLACVNGEYASMAEDSPFGDDVLVAPTATIGAGVSFTGPCIVGPGARIDDGASLCECVVLPGGVVPAGGLVATGIVGDLDALAAWADAIGSAALGTTS